MNALVPCLRVSNYRTSLPVLPSSSLSLTAFRPADVLMTLNDAIRKTCVAVVSLIKAHMPVNFVERMQNEKFRKK
jgi:hypothetical protein